MPSISTGLEGEEDYDVVYIYPGNIALPATGVEFDTWQLSHPPLQEFTGVYRGWSESVPGSSVQIVLRTNDVGTFYGYKVTKVLRNAAVNKDFSEYATGDVQGSPWLGDANGDGILDLLYAADDQLHLLKLNTPYKPENLEWPMYRHDPQRTNAYVPPQPLPTANQPPQLQPIGNRAIKEGQSLQFALRAVDPNGQALTYNVQFGTPAPPGSSYDAATKTFRMTPPVGTITPPAVKQPYPSVRFRVTDGSLADQEDVVFTVERDVPPDFPPIPEQSIEEDETLTLPLVASDPNGDPLTFTAADLPRGASLSTGGEFSWTPGTDQAQPTPYTITVTVSDGIQSVSQPLRITVIDVPIAFFDDFEPKAGAPVWASTGFWHVTTRRANSPSHAWWYGQEATRNYDNGFANSGTFTSPPIDLRQATAASLSFLSWSQTETTNSYDKRFVEVSVNNGPWTILGAQLSNAAADQQRWISVARDLGAYVGSIVKMRFRFATMDSVANRYEGWYVDTVVVKATIPTVSLSSPQLSSTTLTVNRRFVTYTATVTNGGSTTRSGIATRLWIEQRDATGALMARRKGGGMLLDGCGSNAGDLDPGECAMTDVLSANDLMAEGTGKFVPASPTTTGNATAIVELIDGTGMVLTSQTVAVRLLAPIVVQVPNGGEVWQVGTTQTLGWTGGAPEGTVTLLLAPPSRVSAAILASGTPNDGTHPWPIPLDRPPGKYVIGVNVPGGMVDFSDAPFHIETLLSNGSFERGARDWSFPSGTSLTTETAANGPTTAAKFILDPSVSRTVTHARIPVTAGATYQVSAAVKTALASGSAFVRIRWFNAAGGQVPPDTSVGSAAMMGTTDWTTKTVTVPAPSGAVAAEIQLRTTTGSGAAYFDDVRVFRTQ